VPDDKSISNQQLVIYKLDPASPLIVGGWRITIGENSATTSPSAPSDVHEDAGCSVCASTLLKAAGRVSVDEADHSGRPGFSSQPVEGAYVTQDRDGHVNIFVEEGSEVEVNARQLMSCSPLRLSITKIGNDRDGYVPYEMYKAAQIACRMMHS